MSHVTPMDSAAASACRILNAGGFELSNLSERKQKALGLLAWQDPAIVAAVIELMGAARDAAARDCPHLGAVI